MIGFIGFGNMANAIVNGLINNNVIAANDIYIFDIDNEKCYNAKQNFGINICRDYDEVFKNAKYIILAIKPNVYKDIYRVIKSNYYDDKVLISLAAGITIDEIVKNTGWNKIVRLMPNVPALINSGVIAATIVKLDNEEREFVTKMLSSIGRVFITSEENINKFSALSGSGPAFVAMFIEALVDAAIYLGMPYKEALDIVLETIIGTSELLKHKNISTSELKYMVCSPGGTTIEGIRTMEEKGFKTAVIETIINTYKKNLNIR